MVFDTCLFQIGNRMNVQSISYFLSIFVGPFYPLGAINLLGFRDGDGVVVPNEGFQNRQLSQSFEGLGLGLRMFKVGASGLFRVRVQGS